MSKLEELIEKFCPDGVKYKIFNEVAQYVRGVSYNKTKEINDGSNGHKLLRANNITLSSNTLNFDEIKIIDFSVNVKENQKLIKDDILICAGSGSIEHIGKVAFIEEDIDYTFGGFMGVIRVNNNLILPRYMFHIMTSSIFKEHLLKVSNSSTINNINNDTWKNFCFPVPPLEVQCEIVHILDYFTLLSAELSAELKAREKQYDYYENKLFDFEGNKIEYKQLNFEEIATFSQGIQVDINKQHHEPFENSVPFLRIVDFVNKNEPPRFIEKPSEKYIKQENEMIMIRYGASAAGKVFIKKYGAIANNMFKINLKENIDIDLKYLMYYLSQDKIYKLLNSSGKSTMPAINFGFLGKLCIEIPSIEEQKRIVNILERFDKLCNDILEGLPAEIEARRKQYEYYREKLLNFKELKVEE